MLGFIIWPIVIWYGAMRRTFWPDIVRAPAVVAAITTVLGAILAAGRAPDAQTLAIAAAAQFAINFMFGAAMFALGVGIAKLLPAKS